MVKKIIPGLALLVAVCISIYSEEMLIKGQVETVRNDGVVTIICDETLTETAYTVLNGENVVIGKIVNPEKIQENKKRFRYLARFVPKDGVPGFLLRAGTNIVIKAPDKEIDRDFVPNTFNEKKEYRETIITPVDGREMVLVSEGKFLMGSDFGDPDEAPEHEEYLPDYYIDKYEVSNSDYKAYADAENIKYPSYWKGYYNSEGSFTDTYFSKMPVIVSWHEAKKYASWAGKRLPEEKEWEKAARSPIPVDRPGQLNVYTWGYVFKNGISNTEEFWADDKTGENLKLTIKQKYGLAVLTRGYLPVDVFEPVAVTYYGCADMDGNAQEWTDSWYRAYNGNNIMDKKYGTQYKVIRGGAYFISGKELRVTDRRVGGIPDLYTDRIAGIRCVKNAADSDRK